jgi:hypothetical protein
MASDADVQVNATISRALPQAGVDLMEAPLRLGRYQDAYVLPVVRKMHLLADEGSFFMTNNGQTGIITPAAVGFVATTPSLIIQNNDSPSNQAAKRLYIDAIELLVTAAGVTATATQAKMLAIVLDGISRYTSGGSNLTPNIVNPNMDLAARQSIASVYFGNLTAVAASANARTVIGQRMVRLPVTATTAPDVINDRVRLEFGSVESITTAVIGSTGALQANVTQEVLKLPPVVIGPGQTLLMHLWQLVAGGTYSTATTYSPEISWWER